MDGSIDRQIEVHSQTETYSTDRRIQTRQIDRLGIDIDITMNRCQTDRQKHRRIYYRYKDKWMDGWTYRYRCHRHTDSIDKQTQNITQIGRQIQIGWMNGQTDIDIYNMDGWMNRQIKKLVDRYRHRNKIVSISHCPHEHQGQLTTKPWLQPSASFFSIPCL